MVLLGEMEAFLGDKVVSDEMGEVHGALVGSGHQDISPGVEGEIVPHHGVCQNAVEEIVHFLEVCLGDVEETDPLNGVGATGPHQLHDVVEMILHLQAFLDETWRLVEETQNCPGAFQGTVVDTALLLEEYLTLEAGCYQRGIVLLPEVSNDLGEALVVHLGRRLEVHLKD